MKKIKLSLQSISFVATALMINIGATAQQSNKINNHPLRRWIESIGQSPLYDSAGGENKSKLRV